MPTSSEALHLLRQVNEIKTQNNGAVGIRLQHEDSTVANILKDYQAFKATAGELSENETNMDPSVPELPQQYCSSPRIQSMKLDGAARKLSFFGPTVLPGISGSINRTATNRMKETYKHYSCISVSNVGDIRIDPIKGFTGKKLKKKNVQKNHGKNMKHTWSSIQPVNYKENIFLVGEPMRRPLYWNFSLPWAVKDQDEEIDNTSPCLSPLHHTSYENLKPGSSCAEPNSVELYEEAETPCNLLQESLTQNVTTSSDQSKKSEEINADSLQKQAKNDKMSLLSRTGVFNQGGYFLMKDLEQAAEEVCRDTMASVLADLSKRSDNPQSVDPKPAEVWVPQDKKDTGCSSVVKEIGESSVYSTQTQLLSKTCIAPSNVNTWQRDLNIICKNNNLEKGSCTESERKSSCVKEGTRLVFGDDVSGKDNTKSYNKINFKFEVERKPLLIYNTPLSRTSFLDRMCLKQGVKKKRKLKKKTPSSQSSRSEEEESDYEKHAESPRSSPTNLNTLLEKVKKEIADKDMGGSNYENEINDQKDDNRSSADWEIRKVFDFNTPPVLPPKFINSSLLSPRRKLLRDTKLNKDLVACDTPDTPTDDSTPASTSTSAMHDYLEDEKEQLAILSQFTKGHRGHYRKNESRVLRLRSVLPPSNPNKLCFVSHFMDCSHEEVKDAIEDGSGGRVKVIQFDPVYLHVYAADSLRSQWIFEVEPMIAASQLLFSGFKLRNLPMHVRMLDEVVLEEHRAYLTYKNIYLEQNRKMLHHAKSKEKRKLRKRKAKQTKNA